MTILSGIMNSKPKLTREEVRKVRAFADWAMRVDASGKDVVIICIGEDMAIPVSLVLLAGLKALAEGSE